MNKNTILDDKQQIENVGRSCYSDTVNVKRKDFKTSHSENNRPKGSKGLSDLKSYRLNDFKKKAAFTLAEVLITLGIIGVVAAITIPNLISNYQKRAWTAQLKKSYATLNQSFRRMLADDNVSALSQTETFSSIGTNNEMCSSENASNICKDFYINLGKYIKISSIKRMDYKYKYLNSEIETNNVYEIITLLDGTIIFSYTFYKNPSYAYPNAIGKLKDNYVGAFIIDINGLKGPNRVGRDIFSFRLADDGILYPSCSEAESQMKYGNNHTYWKTTNTTLRCDKTGSGSCCTARVLEEGKMNY